MLPFSHLTVNSADKETAVAETSGFFHILGSRDKITWSFFRLNWLLVGLWSFNYRTIFLAILILS